MLKIKSLREKAGISQAELARRVGVTPATVCRWEYESVMPSLMQVPKLADALGVGIADLFQQEAS